MSNWEDETNSAGNYSAQTCPVCGKEGRASLKVYVQTANGPKFLVNSSVCLYCNDRHGRFETMYTGTYDRPDFSCKEAKLPQGVTLEDIHRALINNPTRRIFTIYELTAGRRTLF